LNYFGNDGSRMDTLEKILDYYTPDLFMVQEIKNSSGFQEIVAAMNNVSDDIYLGGTWAPQISNPGSSNPLQQNIVYNTRVLGLSFETFYTTNIRDINYFKLFLKSAELEAGGDTTFVHVYSVHFKSSQGFTNEQKRLAMAETSKDAMNLLPPDSYILFGGDFNVYRSTEPAYQKLLEPGLNYQLIDPIDMPGEWTESSFPNKEIMTQSTRLSPLSDGAGGGMDDRFDFVMHSDNLHQGNADLRFVEGSYDALGNNGSCFNQDLINCTTTDNVPAEIISALYYFSDHLPVVFSMTSDFAVSTGEPIVLDDWRVFPNPTSGRVTIETQAANSAMLIVFDGLGRQVLAQEVAGTTTIDLSRFSPGMYHISLIGENGPQVLERVVLQP
ncbi:MAG: T9SS type A sorting domain-containing protein, partial [Bacteroidota bacterium]